ncbi:MerR family transcriptional regulator [Nocardia sp. NPDC004068]|uniref:MerR family transcriptional regulator n=1 Tax=Nocardia sp. NPDC004068 TaxID=3364303 RepID=UPI003684AC86
MDDIEHTVGTVAELTGVSIRTLHHYDEIGLLTPTDRSASGYRLYGDADLQRLQRIPFYRELGLGLDAIAAVLNDPQVSEEDHLRRQRALLSERVARYTDMIAVIDKELAARAAGIALTPAERLEVFGDDRLIDRAAEAERRWGGTTHFAQRRERSADYTKAEWLTLRAEQREIHQALADALRANIPADAPVAMDLAECHRLHLERWFHDCDHDTHAHLAADYRDNRRIGLNYNDMAPGLSRYIHDAILANRRRHS